MTANMAKAANIDLIVNGVGTGRVAQRLLQCNGDIGSMRPWIGEDGRAYITVNEGGVATAKLLAYQRGSKGGMEGFVDPTGFMRLTQVIEMLALVVRT